jgi:hypothetical protein
MSLALGMDYPGRSRVYQGWYGPVPVGLWPFETEYQKWTRIEWEFLGAGLNLDGAIMYAIDGQTEFTDPNAPVNTYRLKGQGLMIDLVLNND